MLIDHGMAASSASLGPGETAPLCTKAAGALTVFLKQPTAHGPSPTAHFVLLATAKKLGAWFLFSTGHGHLASVRQEEKVSVRALTFAMPALLD